jgi:hypothetical protein
VLEERTTEEQSSVVLLLWAKGLNTVDIHRKMFHAYSGKCLSRKAVHNWVVNVSLTRDLKGGAEVAETTVKRPVRCEFRRSGKARGQVYQCWWKICRELNVFPRFEYRMFYVLYPFVTYFPTLPRTILLYEHKARVL